jgi:general secretion pathway protein A
VVIDEAQNLEPSVLETVRLLSDFETPRAKLLQIILAGQPELGDKLASPSLSQLRQRISILNKIEPLPSWEIKDYVEHRLKVAGYVGGPLFTPQALEEIGQFTEGIPRNVNNFCFNALSLACALRHKTVDVDVVREVISDLDISGMGSEHPPKAAPVDGFKPPVQNVASLPAPRTKGEMLSPAEARNYMQDVASKLKNWQASLNQRQKPVRPGNTEPD